MPWREGALKGALSHHNKKGPKSPRDIIDAWHYCEPMKTLFALFITLSTLNPALAASDAEKSRMARNLVNAVKANCEMPSHMAPYTMANFERYVVQILYPDLKMLSTAFLNGFSAFESKNLQRGYCVIVFLGLPNNPSWEGHMDFYGKAIEAGKMPSQMFAGFDENGNVLYQPVSDLN